MNELWEPGLWLAFIAITGIYWVPLLFLLVGVIFYSDN